MWELLHPVRFPCCSRGTQRVLVKHFALQQRQYSRNSRVCQHFSSVLGSKPGRANRQLRTRDSDTGVMMHVDCTQFLKKNLDAAAQSKPRVPHLPGAEPPTFTQFSRLVS